MEEAATYVEFHPFCHLMSVIRSFIDFDRFSSISMRLGQEKERQVKEKRKKEEERKENVFSR